MEKANYAVLYHDVRGHRELREVCASPEGAEKYIINAHADASVVQIEWDSGHTYCSMRARYPGSRGGVEMFFYSIQAHKVID